MVTPAMRTTSLLVVLKFDNYAVLRFAMTNGLARDSHKIMFKITLTLRYHILCIV